MIAGIIIFSAVLGIFISWCLMVGGGQRDED
jgi:hypothetical protein